MRPKLSDHGMCALLQLLLKKCFEKGTDAVTARQTKLLKPVSAYILDIERSIFFINMNPKTKIIADTKLRVMQRRVALATFYGSLAGRFDNVYL